MAQSKLAFVLMVALSAWVLSACARTTAARKETQVAAASSQSLIAPNGGFSDETPAQRRREWLNSKTGDD